MLKKASTTHFHNSPVSTCVLQAAFMQEHQFYLRAVHFTKKEDHHVVQIQVHVVRELQEAQIVVSLYDEVNKPEVVRSFEFAGIAGVVIEDRVAFKDVLREPQEKVCGRQSAVLRVDDQIIVFVHVQKVLHEDFLEAFHLHVFYLLHDIQRRFYAAQVQKY